MERGFYRMNGANQSPSEFWRNTSGVEHITPGGKWLPEGDWFAESMRSLGRIGNSVVEFGCGPGRLAGFFEKRLYEGVDINGNAVGEARRRNPGYRFTTLRGAQLPPADVYLCHTVLLHIPDDEISRTVEMFGDTDVIVSEVMGRKWRRAGDPPVFNREPEEYIDIFGRYGLQNTSLEKAPYEHYKNTDLTMMMFSKC